MHSSTFFRAAMTVVVLLCCALVAFQQSRVRKRPHMVTELVSVTYVPARPASAPASSPVAEQTPAAHPPDRVAGAAPEPPVTPHVKIVRNSRKTVVASTRAPARVVVATAKPKPTQAASKKQNRREMPRDTGTMVAAAPPPVPSFLLPVRRLGFSLQRRLVHAGLLKVCSGPQSRPGSDCVRPAPDG